MNTNGHRKNGAEVIARMETITPLIAGDLLEKNTYNRKMSNAIAKRLATSITEGNWHGENAETIKIADDGTILDGQHRLTAVVMADTPVRMMVARGVPKESFETIDIGRVRRMEDMLYIRGMSEYTRELATALGTLWGYRENGNFGSLSLARRPTPTELFALEAEAGEAIRTSIPIGAKLARRLVVVKPNVAIIVHFILSRINEPEATAFFASMTDGRNLDDSLMRLRDRLMNARQGIKRNEAAALLIKAWNALRLGTKQQQIGFRSKGPKGEQFPKPV